MASKVFRFFSPLVDILPERERIKALYLYKFHRLPDLDQPKTFNEKVQWRKLCDRRTKFTTLVDKLAVKKYIKTKCTEVIVPNLIWSGKSLSDLGSEGLPNKYVIKSNHASGTNYIVRNGEHPSRSTLKYLEKLWRSIDVSKTFVEWAYSEIEIKFFVEEFLDISESVPVDYKFWVFHGKVRFVQVDVDRFVGHKRAFFSTNFERLPFLLTFPDIDREIAPPNNFRDMVAIAEKLSNNLDFVRVDLYSDDENVYFGEFTMYPGGGYEVFQPLSSDFDVGALWSLPSLCK